MGKVGATDGNGNEGFLDAAGLEKLRESISTFAPDLIVPVAPKAEVPGRRDQYLGVVPKQQHEDDGGSVSSVRPRERKGAGLPIHQLLGRQQEVEPEPELEDEPLPLEPEPEYDGPPLDPELHEPAQHYEVSELLEDEADLQCPYVPHPDEDIDSMGDPENRIADSLLEDAILDAYRDNMAALAHANGTRDFVRGEDLWHERYRHDARGRMDADEARERQRNADNDRRAAEDRRRLDDLLNRR